jgi:hypothetical protein
MLDVLVLAIPDARPLRDKTRPSGRAPVADDRTKAIVEMTLRPPPHEATHWTARAMAKVSGLAVSTVERFLLSPPIAPNAHRLAARGRWALPGKGPSLRGGAAA